VNLYTYVGNSPLNFVDPWGLRREKAWFDKLGEGYYYGTDFGREAAEWYAQQQINSGNPLLAIPGSIASLWTPETYQDAGWILITAGSLKISPKHIGIDLPGQLNILHYGMDARYGATGRHIGILFKGVRKALFHIDF